MTKYRFPCCADGGVENCSGPCIGAWFFWMIGLAGAVALVVVAFVQVPGGDTLLKTHNELGLLGIAPIVGGLVGCGFDMCDAQKDDKPLWKNPFAGLSFLAMLFLLVGGILALVFAGGATMSPVPMTVLFSLGAAVFVGSCLISIPEDRRDSVNSRTTSGSLPPMGINTRNYSDLSLPDGDASGGGDSASDEGYLAGAGDEELSREGDGPPPLTEHPSGFKVGQKVMRDGEECEITELGLDGNECEVKFTGQSDVRHIWVDFRGLEAHRRLATMDRLLNQMQQA